MMPSPKKIMTLALVHRHPQILLGLKKEGFGAGRWNGFGGKVEEGESIEEAARREVREECGIECDRLAKLGLLRFEFEDDPLALEVHVFKATEYRGEPVETAEMKPQWFMVDDTPFKDMWQDDVYWMPLFLKGRKFQGRFLFDKDHNLLNREVREVTDESSWAR
ncbi:MAG: 8-oxo-dGTP diphosphatase / 2-hydroxy-dATP diphosphatase [Candidatus Parcubacteria bacterium]|nr:8-oxo-dGTP diphosphatase / 2-hydroxy-dATP diphosphatase [Candidatus Parcubacteria bacterium]